MAEDSTVSSTVFAFVLVLCILIFYAGGVYSCWFFYNRKRRTIEKQRDELERERMQIHSKEADVHQQLVHQYSTEVDHWRTEAKRRLVESEAYRRRLEGCGVDVPERPFSVALSDPSFQGGEVQDNNGSSTIMPGAKDGKRMSMMEQIGGSKEHLDVPSQA